MKMASPAQRMKNMRERRQATGLRELRLVLPDARSASVRRRVANAVVRLSQRSEAEALDWIENISEFDERLDP
jgi:hypothetical protein